MYPSCYFGLKINHLATLVGPRIQIVWRVQAFHIVEENNQLVDGSFGHAENKLT
jgi:hypothetical protein